MRHLTEHLDEGGRILRAGHTVLAVDHEEGHALDSVLLSLTLIGADGGQVLPRFERSHDVVSIESDLCGEVGQVVYAADVAALFEVGLQESLLGLQLETLRLGVVGV